MGHDEVYRSEPGSPNSLWSVFREIFTRPQSPIHNWSGGSQVLIRDGSSSPQKGSQPIGLVSTGIYQTLQTVLTYWLGTKY